MRFFEFVKKASKVQSVLQFTYYYNSKSIFIRFKAHFESLGKMDTSNMTTYLVAGIDF